MASDRCPVCEYVYDEAAGAVLDEILGGLDDDARAVLADALPVLEELTSALVDRMATEPPD